MQRPKEYDCVRLKDGREGTIVGVYSGPERLHEIEDTTEFIKATDIEKITYVHIVE